MSGKYCYLGQVLNTGNDEEGMIPKIHHFESDLYYVRESVKEKVQSISTTEPSLISFTHWH